MPKPKDAKGAKSAKAKAKNKQSAPETADDVLAAGVEFEEAGEKWRSGDTAKSSRFFVRALEAYESGLHRFPTSFDLAYNRARLFFELTQQPRHMQQIRSSGTTLLSMSSPLTSIASELLGSALYFTLYALELDQENADAIFNLAQIHFSLAEAAMDEYSASIPEDNAIYHLEKAIELFEKCFTIQHSRYRPTTDIPTDSFTEDSEQIVAEEIESGVGAATASEDVQAQPDEQWASIEALITESTLIDTCVAELEALTMIVTLVSRDQSKLQPIEAKITALVQTAESYLSLVEDDAVRLEFYRAKAKAAAVLLVASFKLAFISAQECSQQIDASFEFTGRDSDAEALSESAEARIEFNVACISKMDSSDLTPAELQEKLHLQWRQLSTALSHLSVAAKLPRAPNVWLLHSRKADVELYRCRLAEAPFHYEPAHSNNKTMLKNAEVFYRGAKNLANAAGEASFARDVAQREQVVQHLQGREVSSAALAATMREMVEDGLLSQT